MKIGLQQWVWGFHQWLTVIWLTEEQWSLKRSHRSCWMSFLTWTVHENGADVTVFIRDVADDFCNILVLDDYTLLLFMAIWCVSCLIYFIIWDFVFLHSISKVLKISVFFGHSGGVCMQRGSGGQFLDTGQRSSPPPHPRPVLKPILAVLHKILLVFSVPELC